MPDDNRDYHGRFKPGTILRDRYVILSVLCGRETKRVYQGRDLSFSEQERLVAIKEMVVPPDVPQKFRAELFGAIHREASVLAALSHPALPQIYDFFEENDHLYLVMEFVDGYDLEFIMKNTRQLPLDKMVEWVVELCDVLDYLHSHQPEPIIVRKLEPQKLVINRNGHVRLMNFGIEKRIPYYGKRGHSLGPEGYEAPETYKGKYSPLSDIYSMGAILHYLVTDQDPRQYPPFTFDERPLHEYRDDVPGGLADIMNKALAFDAKDRWQNAAEMKSALEHLRASTNFTDSTGTGDTPE